MAYEDLDQSISLWAERHSLLLVKQSGGADVRGVYVSSQSGECYQIWIGLPSSGEVLVSAACIEGPREDDPPQEWSVEVDKLEDALEEAFHTVIGWMSPSTRYVPATTTAATFEGDP